MLPPIPEKLELVDIELPFTTCGDRSSADDRDMWRSGVISRVALLLRSNEPNLRVARFAFNKKPPIMNQFMLLCMNIRGGLSSCLPVVELYSIKLWPVVGSRFTLNKLKTNPNQLSVVCFEKSAADQLPRSWVTWMNFFPESTLTSCLQKSRDQSTFQKVVQLNWNWNQRNDLPLKRL